MRILILGTVLAVLAAACGGSPDPVASPVAGGANTPLPASSPAPDASPAPGATPTPTPQLSRPPLLQAPAYASRVTVAESGIDLPVISGDLQPPPSYPLCDVAAYLTRFAQPFEPGITYISAHAQEGMFLPLLEASLRRDGRELIGQQVDVYTDDGMRYGYTITEVNRNAVDYSFLADLPRDERYLVLQTSEGPFGTLEKLQVLAEPLDEEAVDPAVADPEANPRDCRPEELTGGPTAAPDAEPSPVIISAPTPSLSPDGVPTPAPDDPASPAPSGSPAAVGTFAPAHFASRVVVEELDIDLPVISGDLQPPPNYPFCDVAAYVTFLAQPGEPGTTYITAHAQEGMFLPILDASQRRDGQEMLGMSIDVYTSDALRYRYEIWQVWRHITDRTIATEGLNPGEQRLVLQTSEGPFGTLEKLGLVARLLDVTEADAEFANPEAEPRDCRPDETEDQ
ncbi:MAG: hypothetical protein M3395_01405 [Chloroflexota bacterium]|nr:hypothetical protein [Chloroflexota bacterium]